MRKKIIIGCLLSTFLILMIPSIPAIEYNNVLEDNKNKIMDVIENIDKNSKISITKNIDVNTLILKIKNF